VFEERISREEQTMSHLRFRSLRICLLVLVACFLVATAPLSAASSGHTLKVIVPDEDRFTPFALTIHPGDSVQWVNNDSDDHTVVSDDAFTTAGHKDTDHILDANGGTFILRFTHSGTFVYYCRFHAHLDNFHQPVAPGPEGGIQGSKGNFGTPMSGVVTVLPSGDGN
jgi:plastocyanin